MHVAKSNALKFFNLIHDIDTISKWVIRCIELVCKAIPYRDTTDFFQIQKQSIHMPPFLDSLNSIDFVGS